MLSKGKVMLIRLATVASRFWFVHNLRGQRLGVVCQMSIQVNKVHCIKCLKQKGEGSEHPQNCVYIEYERPLVCANHQTLVGFDTDILDVKVYKK